MIMVRHDPTRLSSMWHVTTDRWEPAFCGAGAPAGGWVHVAAEPPRRHICYQCTDLAAKRAAREARREKTTFP